MDLLICTRNTSSVEYIYYICLYCRLHNLRVKAQHNEGFEDVQSWSWRVGKNYSSCSFNTKFSELNGGSWGRYTPVTPFFAAVVSPHESWWWLLPGWAVVCPHNLTSFFGIYSATAATEIWQISNRCDKRWQFNVIERGRLSWTSLLDLGGKSPSSSRWELRK